MKNKALYIFAVISLSLICAAVIFINNVSKSNNELKVIIPSIEVSRADSLIRIFNGLVYYKGKLFSGTLTENYPGGKKKSRTSYFVGQKWGEELLWYFSGQLYTRRFYKYGMKDSINTGYWPNGNKKFEYYFSTGSYNGSFKEWYPDGNLSIWMNYKNGQEDGSQRGWRENGKLFINYVVKNGKTYGAVKSRLCYSVKNGKGQFTSSSNNNTYDSGSSSSKLLP